MNSAAHEGGAATGRLPGWDVKVLATAIRLLIATALVVAVASACGSGGGSPADNDNPTATGSARTVETAGGSYQQVDAAQLQSMLTSKDFVFVNVHIPYEGEIEGTDLFIPYDTMEQQLSELPSDKNGKIFLYCRSGRMSAIAAEVLVSKGYTNVWELKGGMIAWEEAGYPIAETGG
jgi:rhodanese-related sulfurtransferase